jgi:hypothetical protein
MWIQNQEIGQMQTQKGQESSLSNMIFFWWIPQQINMDCGLGNLQRTELSGFLMLPVPQKI